MGYIINHSIVVTSWSDDLIAEARVYAASTGAQVSEVVSTAVNGGGSFLVAPDGSKEDWRESDTGDKQRATIKAFLVSKQHSDGSNSLKWYEVEWPEDGPPEFTDWEKPLPGTELYEEPDEP